MQGLGCGGQVALIYSVVGQADECEALSHAIPRLLASCDSFLIGGLRLRDVALHRLRVPKSEQDPRLQYPIVDVLGDRECVLERGTRCAMITEPVGKGSGCEQGFCEDSGAARATC